MHAGDEFVDEFAVFFKLMIFHPTVVEVRVEVFGDLELCEEDGFFDFGGDFAHKLSNRGVFLRADAAAMHLGNCDVGNGAPEFLGRLEDVAFSVFAVRVT